VSAETEHVLVAWEDIAGRYDRLMKSAIRMCVAIEAADPALLEDHVRDAAAGFRATVEENCP